MSAKVDAFLKRQKKWRAEMEALRAIALDCGLEEDLKWGKPCYAFAGGNVAILQGFKESCALMFFKGALLDDPNGLLERPGKSSHAARRMMFASLEEVAASEKRLRAFIAQAKDVEEKGLKVALPAEREPVPEELEAMFGEVRGLKKAFESLTPGRQRAYILHFSGAKQSKTRRARVEKHVPRILDGKGLDDR